MRFIQLSLIGCSILSQSAHAGMPYTQVSITGSVNDYSRYMIDSLFYPGQSVVAEFLVDNTIADSNPADPVEGYFQSAIVSMSLVFGSNEVAITSTTGDVYTTNDEGEFDWEHLGLEATHAGMELVTGDVNGYTPYAVYALFSIAGLDLMATDGLTDGLEVIVPAPHRIFQLYFLETGGVGGNPDVFIDVTSVIATQVPSNGTACVLLLAGLTGCRRRR